MDQYDEKSEFKNMHTKFLCLRTESILVFFSILICLSMLKDLKFLNIEFFSVFVYDRYFFILCKIINSSIIKLLEHKLNFSIKLIHYIISLSLIINLIYKS